MGSNPGYLLFIFSTRIDYLDNLFQVSKALNDIKNYIMENQTTDRLLLGFAGNDKSNPYREKTSCDIL